MMGPPSEVGDGEEGPSTGGEREDDGMARRREERKERTGDLVLSCDFSEVVHVLLPIYQKKT